MRQALVDLAVPDLGEFDAELVAEDIAELMFEVMEARAFAQAWRTYTTAKPEDLPTLTQSQRYIALAEEFEHEWRGARLKQRRAEGHAHGEPV